MTLPLPNLDDRTYADLVAEARSQISIEYPDWTDHNPSDTGIILIELLAWLTELALYRVNQLPDQNTVTFLSLLQGKELTLPSEDLPAALKQELRKTIVELRQRFRAVTPADFAALMLDWNQTEEARTFGKVKRSHCLPGRNLESPPSKSRDDSAHISLIVLPDPANNNRQTTELLAALKAWFEPRRLLTTHHHIVLPKYVPIQPSATLYLEDGANPQEVRQRAIDEVRDFFDPLASGRYWNGKGWPFGRSIYAAELYSLLDGVSGVDYVREVKLIPGSAESITIAPHELVAATVNDSSFTLMEQSGDEWRPIDQQ